MIYMINKILGLVILIRNNIHSSNLPAYLTLRLCGFARNCLFFSNAKTQRNYLVNPVHPCDHL